eukprot:1506940-Pyramimonas_sp.AAC.1
MVLRARRKKSWYNDGKAWQKCREYKTGLSLDPGGVTEKERLDTSSSNRRGQGLESGADGLVDS